MGPFLPNPNLVIFQISSKPTESFGLRNSALRKTLADWAIWGESGAGKCRDT